MTGSDLIQGFPPSSGGQVDLTNWRKPPFNQWSFTHVREIVPTAEIASRETGHLLPPEAPVEFGGMQVNHAGASRRFHDVLLETDTDGLAVLHRGMLVCEYYGPTMSRRTPHILMSVSKSILGLLAGILVEKRLIDLNSKVTDWIPELTSTAYARASLRDFLDMRVGVKFSETTRPPLAPLSPTGKLRGGIRWRLGRCPQTSEASFPTSPKNKVAMEVTCTMYHPTPTCSAG